MISIFGGYYLKDLFLGFGSNFFQDSISISKAAHDAQILAEFLPISIKLIPVVASLVGGIFSVVLYLNYFHVLVDVCLCWCYSVFSLFVYRLYFDRLYNQFSIFFLLSVGYDCLYELLEKGVFEVFGPYGATKVFYLMAKSLRKFHTGFMHHYFCFGLLGLFVCLLFLEYLFFIS